MNDFSIGDWNVLSEKGMERERSIDKLMSVNISGKQRKKK